MSSRIAGMKDKGYFGNFEPKEVFIWLDGPRTFSLLDQDGQLCFAHWLQEVEDLWQFVVVPVTENILKELNNGELSLRDVLQQPRIYVVAVASDASVQSITLTSWDELPQEALPEPGTMIRRDLEPFFRLKSIGDTIRPGDIPASVIKTTVENAQKAIRLLAEYELNHPSRKGKRSKALRELYDLPAQKIQAASFEVSFRSPFSQPSLFDNLPPSEIEEDKSILERVCEHLRTGLAWLESKGDEDLLAGRDLDPILKSRILEAVKYLTPPTNGAIQKTHVSGKAFQIARVVELDRNDRRRVIAQQKKIAGTNIPKRFEETGTIIDILGEDAELCVEFKTEASTIQRDCKFSDELWEVYGEKLHFNQSIRVYGVVSTSKEPITVLEVGFPDETGESVGEAQ